VAIKLFEKVSKSRACLAYQYLPIPGGAAYVNNSRPGLKPVHTVAEK